MPKKSKYDRYTDWILEHYKEYRNCTELAEALKDIFGLDANSSAIKYWFAKRFGTYTMYGCHDFSEAEDEFIKKYYPDNGPEKTVEMLNEIFDTNRTRNSVRYRANKKLNVHVSESFTKALVKSNCDKMHNSWSKQSGTVRQYVRKDGRGIEYVMKASDGQWKTAGIVIWEEANGQIPEGYRLIYLDGDNSNYQLDNLYLASFRLAHQVVRNKCYQSGNPEITKSLIKYYELRNALGINFQEWKRIEYKFSKILSKYGKEFVLDG